jgi:aminoglycoside phosphotransferase (APT) family kinase protein
MEDMTPTHSVIKNDLTLSQIRNVISTLADVQSRFWRDSRVPKYDLSHYVNSININMGQSWDVFKDRYQEKLGKETTAFEWMLKNPEIVASHYNSNPTILSHGDVNVSNLLFPSDGSDRPILIDWQLAAQRIIPFDLSYFLVKSLTVKQRREHEDMLLKEYYALLADQIRSSYTFDRLILDYRACATRSMLSATMRVGPRYDSYPNRFEAADELATRVIGAVRDLKPVDAIEELEKHGWLKKA